jgi:hypothetical protein
MLDFASATSAIPDTHKAATTAIREALTTLDAARCQVVVFHVTMGHDPEVALRAIKAVVPHARVVGNSCAGIIGRDGANESMRALALAAIAGPSSEIAVVSCDGVYGETSRATTQKLAEEVRHQLGPVQSAMYIGPGIDIDMDEVVAGFEAVFGTETVLFGGTASDNMKGIATYQCIDDKVYEHAAYLIGFADPTLSITTQATHGFVPAGIEFEVTRATGHRVHELDGKPAWQVYTHGLGLAPTATPGDTIPPGALGVALSPELAAEYGDSHILRVVTHCEPDGTFLMPVTCPVGTRLSLMRRDEGRIFANLGVTMNELVSRTGGLRPVAVFHTDCGARGRLMLDRVSKDEIVADMQGPLFGDTCGPWLGMYGFGEITVLGGRNLFHNYTTSLYVFTRAEA